jgi:beta-fructofuranosidase
MALAACLFLNGLQAQSLWTFETATTRVFQDARGGASLSFSHSGRKPELVPGVKGTALRTDGYSTWLTGKFSKVQKTPVSMSGWFALESYPTDTAGFFVLSHAANGEWISASVDRFGKPMVGIRSKEKLAYFAAEKPLPKFKWNHVALNMAHNRIELFINGERQQVIEQAGLPAQFDAVMIGKDAREKAIGIFPVTAINGLIDEVQITQTPFTLTAAIRQDIAKGRQVTPQLSVPESRFRNDFYRPRYHLLPAANWTNETHGLLYYQGRYHLFNQKNASNIFLGQINWGHFSSPDLITWTEHKPALSPGPEYDEHGIWSGHVVLSNEGVPTIIYTAGGKRNGVALAYPKDSGLIEWTKYAGNPVILGQPSGYSRTDLRDPYVWKEGDKWYMIIGFGIQEGEREKGAVLLYTSPDLKSWTFRHTLFEGNPSVDNSGVFWEMPVFVRMQNKYVLLVNKVPHKGVPAVALYWTGDFVNEKFIPDTLVPQKLEVVNRLLSPSVAQDKEGRLTAIAIIPDEITARAAYQNGWNHLYSIPRVWTLEGGKIHQQPHPVLQKLRTERIAVQEQTITPGRNVLLSKGTHQLEIEAELDPAGSKRFGFVVGKSPDGSEYTKIYYDREKQEFVVDQTKSSKREHIPLDIRTGSYPLDSITKMKLHVFIDGSVVEVFVNGQDAFTTRLFPLSPLSNIVEAFSEGGSVQLKSASIWKLRSSNNKADF